MLNDPGYSETVVYFGAFAQLQARNERRHALSDRLITRDRPRLPQKLSNSTPRPIKRGSAKNPSKNLRGRSQLCVATNSSRPS
jgi:hypothetical protein